MNYKQTEMTNGIIQQTEMTNGIIHREYPPCKRSIITTDGFRFIEFPYLNFVFIPLCGLYVGVRHEPLTCDDDKLFALPFPNCYCTAKVCLGGDDNYLPNIESAINMFWTTKFNIQMLNDYYLKDAFDFSTKWRFVTCLKDFAIEHKIRFYYKNKLYQFEDNHHKTAYCYTSYCYFYFHPNKEETYYIDINCGYPAFAVDDHIMHCSNKITSRNILGCAKLVDKQ